MHIIPDVNKLYMYIDIFKIIPTRHPLLLNKYMP